MCVGREFVEEEIANQEGRICARIRICGSSSL
jgi:hypothetical protein